MVQTASYNNDRENIINLLLNNYSSVYCNFRDSAGELVDVNTISGAAIVTIIDNNKDLRDPERNVVSGELYRVDVGLYGYDLKPRDLDAGLYDLLFVGSDQTADPYVSLAVAGSMKISEASFVQDLTRRVRLKLKDVNVNLYQLDLPVNIWTDEEIYYALIEAIEEINAAPPMRKNWTFSDVESYGHGVSGLMVRSAFANLLESKAVLEAANTMSHSDGSANLNIQRGQIYSSLSNNIRQDVNKKIDGWKRSLVPNLYGQGTSVYPYQLRRAISFLPGFKNIFG